MKANIEIEERSLVSKEQYNRLHKHLESLGAVQTSRRVMINFTALDYERSESIELRLNDGKLTKVVKKGAFGGTTFEQTTELHTTLEQALQIMAEQGYDHAKISLRIRHVVRSGGYEYCLRDIVRYENPEAFSYPTLFEIEAESASLAEEPAIRQRIAEIMASLQIKVVNKKDFQSWSEFNHNQIDGDFVFSPKMAISLVNKLRTAHFL